MYSRNRSSIALQKLVRFLAWGSFGLCLSVFTNVFQEIARGQSLTINNSAADWRTFNGGYASDRFSPLQQITTGNVNRLEPVCTFDTNEKANFQTGPVVIKGTLYFTTYLNTYAIDGSTCEVKWKHTRATPVTGLNVNRGVAYDDGRLFRGTGDAHVIAIDAATGRQLWDVAIGESERGESVPLAPIAWNGMVFAGNAGGDNFGVAGRIYALSAVDGHILWRFDVVPQSGQARETWLTLPENLPSGGATWTTYSLDTTDGVLYAATGNAAPDFAVLLRPGDNLYSMAVVALDARTGRLQGFVQPLKGDFHDWDLAAAPALFTTRAGHKLIAAGGKDGMIYGIRREGLADETKRAAAKADGSDMKYGAAGRDALAVGFATPVTTRENAEVPLSSEREVRFCPGTQGGVEWNGPSYHPATNMIYTNSVDWCSTVKLAPLDLIKGEAGKSWTGASDRQAPFGRLDPSLSWKGWVTAVDADTGKVQWSYESPTPMLAGITSTAGGLVFTADLNGVVMAFDAASGKTLWQHFGGQPVGGGVVSFATAEGQQRIAVAAAMKSRIWPVDAGTARITIYGLSY